MHNFLDSVPTLKNSILGIIVNYLLAMTISTRTRETFVEMCKTEKLKKL